MNSCKNLFGFALFLGLHNYSSQVLEKTEFLSVDYLKSTTITRYDPPKGFTWLMEIPDSFGDYLNNFPLHPPGFPVLYYNLVPLKQQNYHVAILKIDVRNKNLQQCADA